MKSIHAYMLGMAMLGTDLYNSLWCDVLKSSDNAYPKTKKKLHKDIRSYHRKAYSNKYN